MNLNYALEKNLEFELPTKGARKNARLVGISHSGQGNFVPLAGPGCMRVIYFNIHSVRDLSKEWLKSKKIEFK